MQPVLKLGVPIASKSGRILHELKRGRFNIKYNPSRLELHVGSSVTKYTKSSVQGGTAELIPSHAEIVKATEPAA